MAYTGTSDHDVIIGTDGDEHVYGQDGNDTITTNSGNDQIHGGFGNDQLDGGQGEDVIYGDADAVNPDFIKTYDDNLVVNGQFEADILLNSEEASLSSVTGWSTNGLGPLKVLDQGDAAGDGETVAILGAAGHAHEIDQSFQTFPGQTYAISLDLELVNTNWVLPLIVEIDGQEVAKFYPTAQQTTFNVDFVAQGGSQTLTLRTEVSTSSGVMIDNVRVSPVAHTDVDDSIDGGAGNDTIYASFGNDTVNGGEGNDTLYGEAGSDRLDGGAGDDRLFFDASDASVVGGEGFDEAFVHTTDAVNFDFGAGEVEAVYANIGDDIIYSSNENSGVVYGNMGDDHISGGYPGNQAIVDWLARVRAGRAGS